MNGLEQTQLYHDAAGMDKLRQAGQNNDKAALRQAAQHFESLFMNMLLKSMRKANDVLADENSPFNSQTTKFYRDMQDDQMAMDLSKSGALGLADIIVDQLGPDKDRYMPGSVMRSDGFRPFSSSSQDENKDPEPLEALRIHSQLMEKHVLNVADEKQQPQAQQQQQALMQETEQVEAPLFSNKQDFVDKLLPIAEKVANTIGLPPVAMVAQAALETGWGQKMFKKPSGDNAFNFFGIKADERWQGEVAPKLTQEFKFGQMQSEIANFRAYPNIATGLADYVDFIKGSPRYQKAVNAAHEPKAYFEQLQQAGYATDPNYANKILSVLKDKVFESAELKF